MWEIFSLNCDSFHKAAKNKVLKSERNNKFHIHRCELLFFFSHFSVVEIQQSLMEMESKKMLVTSSAEKIVGEI
jgi:hypothetical protein